MVHLFDRDCSVQRRHQKVVEYAPAFSVPEASRQKIFDSAIRLCKQVGYRNAGTCEFLVDSDGNPYFIEMNPRIQVEHTVTELVTDVDIVRSQILIAEGYPLNSPEINITSQKAIECHGYAIQTRVTSEDPSNNFMPDTGKVSVYHSGSGNGIRLDGGNVYTGAEILPYYDSLLVKVCSFDRTFKGAAVKSLRALREMRIQGIKTNISFLINVINNPTFQAGACYTTFIEETPELFSLSQSPDRVSKILDFLGDKIVNVSKGEKPYFEDRVLPKYDETALVYGAKDEFKKLGAKGFTQKILGEKRLYVTDTSMRDAQPVPDRHPDADQGYCGRGKGLQRDFPERFLRGSLGRRHLRHRLSFPEGVSLEASGDPQRENAQHSDPDAAAGLQRRGIQQLSRQLGEGIHSDLRHQGRGCLPCL